MPRPVRFVPRKPTAASKRVADQLRALGIETKAKRKKNETPEHDAQVTLFDEHLRVRLVPRAVAFAIGNGGLRHPSVAAALKAEGVTAGVPDIFLMHLSQTYFLEMKKPKGGRVSKEQKDMMARLVGAGAICAVAAGLEAAIAQLEAWGLLTVGGVDVGSQQQELAA
jgi:hypothetical protein